MTFTQRGLFRTWTLEQDVVCTSVHPSAPGIKGMGRGGHGPREAQMAAILQLSQYCTFTRDSISTVITEPGQPVSHRGPSAALPGASSVFSSLARLRAPNCPLRVPSCQVRGSEYLTQVALHVGIQLRKLSR